MATLGCSPRWNTSGAALGALATPPIAATICGTSPVPRTASISGISLRSSSLYRSAMQPVTISRWHPPSFLCCAISRMASIDSCLADAMNAQVLTTSTSAFCGSRVSSWPASCARPSMTSESTRFFGHPRETNPIFICPQVYNGLMKKRLLLTLALFTLAVATSFASGAPPRAADSTANLLDRFFAPDDQPLVSYRAFRHLTASTRGGKMSASLDAWTSLDPQRGFTYEITKADGSGLIQKRVLIKALEAEQDAVQSSENKAQSALTPANYQFLEMSSMGGRMVRVNVKPRRNQVMLINGHLVIESDSADLVRVDGELSKRPSFWTRRVHVTREYDRIGGVHVPISMKSEADVLIVGNSAFSMDYKYAEINGKPVS